MEKLINEYKKAFGNYEIPETLIKLIDFNEQYGRAYYSEGFELHTQLDKTASWLWSLDDEYFERFIIFAQADGSGSSYAFWVNEVGVSLENAPIIYDGSEGAKIVVAKNLKELIKLLSFGPECSSGEFYKILDDYEDPENALEFREWMVNELNIEPINSLEVILTDDYNKVYQSEEVNNIMREAFKSYGDPFKKWMNTLTTKFGTFDY